MNSGYTMGNPAAPIVVEEWGDFQCPFCRQFAVQTEPRLRHDLVETGQVKFVWHNFAFLGPESVWAAEAAECAGDRGMFWEYHDKLFAEQDGENSGTFAEANLERFATELGLDVGRFSTCLVNGRYAARVAAEREAGIQEGISWTPSILVNGQLLPGVPSYHDLLRAIADVAQAA